METSSIISVVSLIITVFVTWYFSYKQSRKKIVHFSISQDEIGAGLSKAFPEYKLTFNGRDILENSRLITGGFIYFGKKDIYENKEPIDIIMELNNESDENNSIGIISVLDVTITSSKKGMAVKKSFKENQITFQIDKVFRTNDFFTYSAIIELKQPTNNKLVRDFRETKINNTDIKPLWVGSIKKYENDKKAALNSILSLSVLIIGSALAVFGIISITGNNIRDLIRDLHVIIPMTIFLIVLVYLIVKVSITLLALRKNKEILRIIKNRQ